MKYKNNKIKEIVFKEFNKDYYKSLKDLYEEDYTNKKIYPKKENIFKSLEDIKDLKVVILGQDPYHQPNQAQGLAFSTPKDIKNPPSMVNILKGIKEDLGEDSKCLDGDLTYWNEQGVLLLNTVLTVEDSKANSHKNYGWQTFTDNVIKEISNEFEDIVFILWGGNAHKKIKLIDKNKHYILKGVHPSPLSAYRGFYQQKDFSKTNDYLKSKNKEVIDW